MGAAPAIQRLLQSSVVTFYMFDTCSYSCYFPPCISFQLNMAELSSRPLLSSSPAYLLSPVNLSTVMKMAAVYHLSWSYEGPNDKTCLNQKLQLRFTICFLQLSDLSLVAAAVISYKILHMSFHSVLTNFKQRANVLGARAKPSADLPISSEEIYY
ncbi:hypothetical protein INR49_027368 [Caranx melampygus]|nr:hypothetical protein INR49_027368 [Caranx melampygus]